MSDRPELTKVLSCTSLPSLPTVGVQVLSLTRNPNVSMDQIAKVLETDLALSAKVLKTVNSSMYGLKTPCTTIRRALNFLGLSAVKSIVLGFSLVDSTKNVSGAGGFDISTHWKRSIYGAAAARTIAMKVNKCDPEEAFAAALFQDIGVLAMFTALGEQYTKVVSASPDHGKHADLERAALGFTHCECGAALAAKWRMPDRYVQTIQHHHAPEGTGADSRELVKVVALGAMTASALTAPDAGAHLAGLLANANCWFGLSATEVATLLKEIGQSASELGRLFGKPVGVVPDAASLMRQANEELINQQIMAMREAEELRERNEALVKITITDALTGVGNRKKFQDESARLFEESSTIGRAFALVMCDGDKFKSVNDTHGHHVGDAVLRELAARINAAVGDAGIVCRYGGEEFAALLPGATLHEAIKIAEAARKAIEAPLFDLSATPNAPPTLPITISLGVACNDPSGAGCFTTMTGLIEAADKALYEAKHTGRNRVCSLSAPQAAPVAAVQAPAPEPVAEQVENKDAPQDAAAAEAPARKPGFVRCGPPPAAPKPKAGPTLKVLLVEDDPLAARMIMAVLQKCAGVETEWVRTAPLATERLSQAASNPAKGLGAVLCDLNITAGTALTVLAAMRASPGIARLPFAVTSADEAPATSQQCMAAGATAFISKDSLVQQLPAWITGVQAQVPLARAA